jgi:hypothetical protein
MVAEGNVRSPLLPRWFAEPLVPSLARGVGRSFVSWLPVSSGKNVITTSFSPGWCPPAFRLLTGWPPWLSAVVGVGSSEQFPSFRPVGQDEDPLATMRRSNVRGTEARPDCVIPECGQVAENSCESPRSERSHVLHDNDPRSQYANTFHNGDPQPTTRPLRNAQCRPRDRRN